VIPAAFITEWRSRVPWPESYQVEQDLILSRLMVEIAGNELLGGELVMRGGTCLVAVGTAIAGGPPRRSQRAGLPHWAPALDSGVKASVGPGVQDAYFR